MCMLDCLLVSAIIFYMYKAKIWMGVVTSLQWDMLHFLKPNPQKLVTQPIINTWQSSGYILMIFSMYVDTKDITHNWLIITLLKLALFKI